MKIDQSQISSTRFMYTIAFFLQSSALLTAFLSSITEHDSWIPVLIGGVLCIPLILVYRSLMVNFPENTLLGMLDTVYGPVVGKILGVGYVWFFLTLSALNLTDLGDFTKITVLTETPSMILAIFCVLVVVWAVRHGVKVVTRYSALFTITEFFIVFISTLLLFDKIDLKNFLPMFQLEPIKYIHSTHIIATIPIGELVVLLMLTPSVKLSRKTATKCWFLGVGMGMITLLVVLMRDIAVLGNTMRMFALPGLVTMRLIHLGESLSRVEILFAVALMMLLFFKVAVLCYVSTIAIAQMFKTKKYKNLALIVGIFVVYYGTILYPNNVEHVVISQEMMPFFWGIFEIVIPILTLVIAKIRKLPKKQPEKQKQKQEVQHAWDGS
ncbi:MAG: endospore germination permease [Oscillospiraceae bacterium]|jgi:spore germination protein KB|nr:endospore germination permease [Oscillospiraceae bacterium]